jgi:DNA-binding transcriptional MerR regulator
MCKLTGMPPDVSKVVRSTEAARLAGITYRQLNHWLTLGYIQASGKTSRDDWAAFTEADVAQATALGRCGKAGWSTQHTAAQLRSLTIESGPGWIIVTRDNAMQSADDAYSAVWCSAADLRDVLADSPGPHVLTTTQLTATESVIATRRRTG